MPFAENMQREGRSHAEIERAFKNYLGLKSKNNIRMLPIKRTSSVIHSVLQDLQGRATDDPSPDRILYDLLIESKIKFSFQAHIGRYQVDFLIESLVIEVDGKKDEERDAFLNARGYQVINLPANMVTITPRAIIQAIQEALD
jgi:very-short-patch-repair endonuclease